MASQDQFDIELYSSMATGTSLKTMDDGRILVSAYKGADDSAAPFGAWSWYIEDADKLHKALLADHRGKGISFRGLLESRFCLSSAVRCESALRSYCISMEIGLTEPGA
jgi:hypothetical protein